MKLCFQALITYSVSSRGLKTKCQEEYFVQKIYNGELFSKLYNKELHDLYISSRIIRMVKQGGYSGQGMWPR